MGRPRRIASVSLCLCLSTAAATPTRASTLPFAPTGQRWMQPRIDVDPETTPDPGVTSPSIASPPSTASPPPPTEPSPPPAEPPRRLWPVTPLGLGLAMFASGYLAAVLSANNMRDECELAGDTVCRRRSYILAIPLAGPLIVANHTREPAHYTFAAIQGAGLILIAISAGILLSDRVRRPVFDQNGVRISRRGSLRPGLAQLTVQVRF